MVTIREAVTKKEINTFIKFPWTIYKNDPNWVPPIIMDVRRMLDRKKSPFFEFGEAIYFLAYRNKKCVGRVTAHINHNHNNFHQSRDGFFGFYECVDDSEVSDALLAAAAEWLSARGMSKIMGPANFTVYDEQCLMIDGWDADPPTPVVFENYNPKYYLDQMKHAGFAKEVDWYAYKVDGSQTLSKALLGAKDRIIRKNGFVFRNVNRKKVDEEVAKIKQIFNEAWSDNWGHYPFTDRQMEQIKSAVLLFVDPRICFMVETTDGKPVGVSVTLPDVNPFIKKMNGRILPFGWIHLLRSRRHSTGARTFMMGVLPEYRNMGVDIAMVVETIQVGLSVGYRWSECSLIVETNTNMIRPIEKWGGRRYKSYRIFSKSLN
jgi:ribosomal protein S18 acetylase RimI-like enzyme